MTAAFVEWYWLRKTVVVGEKQALEAVCATQIQHGPPCDRNGASRLKARRLTPWFSVLPPEVWHSTPGFPSNYTASHPIRPQSLLWGTTSPVKLLTLDYDEFHQVRDKCLWPKQVGVKQVTKRSVFLTSVISSKWGNILSPTCSYVK
jgi:hypothetical protein